jgi:histidine triad (HIT) family protein
LLVPRAHIETLVDLSQELIGPFFQAAQALAQAVPFAMKAEGTFVAMNNRVSQSVPHLHVHIVPRRKKDGLKGFFWPRTKYKDDKEMETVARKIAGALQELSR